jgi:hypothetical protein
MMMKQALEQEFKRHLATKNLEAAAIVAQQLRVKCPERRVRHG